MPIEIMKNYIKKIKIISVKFSVFSMSIKKVEKKLKQDRWKNFPEKF